VRRQVYVLDVKEKMTEKHLQISRSQFKLQGFFI